MKYYRMQVIQTRASVIKRCDPLGSVRQRRERHAHGGACLSLKLLEQPPFNSGTLIVHQSPLR
jgi:hypothetical protein